MPMRWKSVRLRRKSLADSSGSFSFTTIARPAQKGLAFRSASSIVSSDAVRMMRV